MGYGLDEGFDYDQNDEYADALADGVWVQRDGSRIRIGQMTTNHLRGAVRVAGGAAKRATCTSDQEVWAEWVAALESEIAIRGKEVAPVAIYVSPEAVKPTRGAKLTMICHCGTEYEARKADIQRGWGLSCSKRCASIRREYGRPAARQKEYAARSSYSTGQEAANHE